MKRASLLCLMAVAACQPSNKTPDEGTWIQLFNGKDLTGWDIKISGHPLNENYLDTFRVEDGLLKVSYDKYERFDGEFGHIYTKERFSDYILRVEYRFVGEQAANGPVWARKNNGAMLHAQSAESMNLDQEFPVSLEAQFLGGLGEDDRPTANLCTPGTHVYIDGELVTRHCTNSTSATYHGEEWVTVEMIVHGDRALYHVVEGDTVMTFTKPHIGGDLPEGFPLAEGTPLTSGHIALQAESHPIEFRKVELLDLSKK
jgi:hypothetical protein